MPGFPSRIAFGCSIFSPSKSQRVCWTCSDYLRFSHLVWISTWSLLYFFRFRGERRWRFDAYSSNPDFAVFGLLTSFETVKKFLPKKRRKARSNRAFLGDIFFVRLRWRRRWDSNPRYPEVQLISSQSRYDHFDTSPYFITGNNTIVYFFVPDVNTLMK